MYDPESASWGCYDPDAVSLIPGVSNSLVVAFAKAVRPMGSSVVEELAKSVKRKATTEICKEVTGWRAGSSGPDYSCVLGSLRDAMARFAFEENVEVEIRLGHAIAKGNGKRFVPGLDDDMFRRVYATLQSGSCWEKVERKTERDFTSGDVRVTMDEDNNVVATVSKRPLWAIDVEALGCPFDFRVCASKETPVELSEDEVKSIVGFSKVRRQKDRQSFVYKYWRYDLTVVTYQDVSSRSEISGCDEIDEDSGDRAESSKETYEIEIEVSGRLPLEPAKDSLYLAESTLLKVLDVAYMIERVDPAGVSFSSRPVKIRHPKPRADMPKA